jgi:LPS O-antigen subunit length determinant protein (WzzB/FepE family)
MYLYIMFIFLLMRSVIWVSGNINWRSFKLNFFSRRTLNINSLLGNNFIDPKVLFAIRFKALANISLIKHIDTSKAYAMIMENFRNEITAVHQFNTYDYNEKKALFNLTIFVLKNKRIIELGYDYAEILYTSKHYKWADALLSNLADFRVTERTKVIGFVNSELMN